MARILIADDSKVIRELLKGLLSAMGHQVIAAEDGQDGLNLFVQERATIDMVLSDLNMPRIDGIEMIRRIKEHCESVPGRKFPPIIALTAQTDPALKSEGRKLGVAAWMNKPIDGDTLKNVIELVFKKHGS